jgi:hypothetical protein
MPRYTRRLTEEEIDKRRQRRVFWFSLFMVGLMVSSILAYTIVDYSNSTDLPMEYGDYEFEYSDLGNGMGVLVTTIEGQEVEFQNLPPQTQYVELDPLAIILLEGAQQVALVSPANLTLENAALADYSRLQLAIAIPKMINAIPEPTSGSPLPVINCSMASPLMPVVIFDQETNTTGAKISVDGFCITLQGQERAVTAMKDRIIFEYYDIMDEVGE